VDGRRRYSAPYKPSPGAADNLRAARAGFTTVIHTVLWAAYGEKIFRNTASMLSTLALNTGR
jgi:hypothetical protein